MFHVKPVFKLYFVLENKISLNSTYLYLDHQSNIACGPHNVTGILSTLTRRMAKDELDIGSIRPNHLKYELSLSSENDQLILSTNMHRCSKNRIIPGIPYHDEK